MRRVSEIEDIGPEPGFSPRAVGYRRATPVTVSRATDEAEKDVSIEQSELTSAIRAMDPNASDQVIIDMIKYADADKDGKVDFEEFKKIMLYKPEEDYKLSDQA